MSRETAAELRLALLTVPVKVATVDAGGIAHEQAGARGAVNERLVCVSSAGLT